MWYDCQHEGWGREDNIIQYYNGNIGAHYQIVESYDSDDMYYNTYCDCNDNGILVYHGPPPKSWVDASDFGEVNPEFISFCNNTMVSTVCEPFTGSTIDYRDICV